MISVYVSFQSRLGSIGSSLFEQCATLVFLGERKSTASLSYVIVDDAGIHVMNRTYLHHDYPTDVITFSLGETGELEGEVYISADTARRNAAEYHVPFWEELARLAIHGALHLCGYDDGTERERVAMQSKEDQYLALLAQSGGKFRRKAS
jgi:probable rRNA maturation factor